MTYAVQLYSKCFHKLWLLGQGSCHSGSKCVVKLFISDTPSILRLGTKSVQSSVRCQSVKIYSFSFAI